VVGYRIDQAELASKLEYLEHEEWCETQKVQCNFSYWVRNTDMVQSRPGEKMGPTPFCRRRT